MSNKTVKYPNRIQLYASRDHHQLIKGHCKRNGLVFMATIDKIIEAGLKALEIDTRLEVGK